MAEVISKEVPKGYYQLFYVYLFLGSLIFLLATYIDLWRTKASWALTDKFKKNGTNHDSVDGIAHKLPRPRVHYGSFYLRLGAVCKYTYLDIFDCELHSRGPEQTQYTNITL